MSRRVWESWEHVSIMGEGWVGSDAVKEMGLLGGPVGDGGIEVIVLRDSSRVDRDAKV